MEAPERSPIARIARFGVFTVDLRTGELLKQGVKIKLQDQPFQVLELLLCRGRDVVTREEIRKKLWPADTFVDFDNSLNAAINKIREALGDSADNSRFIETLPRKGYRCIVPVEWVGSDERQDEQPIIDRVWIIRRGIALGVVGLLLATAFLLCPPPPNRKVMMAVLPFENLSNDKDQEYFSDGLTEEMIAQLGGLDPARLGVIARTSAWRYKKTTEPISQIGRELGVQYVLEGSVRRAGNRVAITAQLIQVSDQTHVWADTYERDLRDVLAVQSDVAHDVAAKIEIKLSPEQQARLASSRPVIPAAHDAYLKGRFSWSKRTPDDLKRANQYFQQAIQIDPNYALAYAGLADSYSMLGSIPYDEMIPREAMPKAEETAERALKLDETLAEAHVSLAYARLTYDWNWPAAEEQFKRALALDPGYATGHQWYAYYLRVMGRLDEAIAELKRAQEIDPLSPVMYAGSAETYYFARQYENVADQCNKAFELYPDYYLAHFWMGRAYEQKGNYAEAIREFLRGKEVTGGSALMTMSLGHAYALAGRQDEARKMLGDLSRLSKGKYVPALYFMAVYAALGDKNQAFRWLGKAYEDRSDYLVYIQREPAADSLRSDPRYQEFVRRMGLPP